MPEGGNIMVFVGMMDAANAKQRYQGLQEVLSGTNIKVIDVRTDNATECARNPTPPIRWSNIPTSLAWSASGRTTVRDSQCRT
jgi:hypothetical protein